MSWRLWKKIKVKIKIIEWFKTKNGRYVYWIFKNVTCNNVFNYSNGIIKVIHNLLRKWKIYLSFTVVDLLTSLYFYYINIIYI